MDFFNELILQNLNNLKEMKQFFKFMFASMLGVLLSLILAFFLFVGVVVAIISSSEEKIKVSPNTVLHLTFDEEVVDRSSDSPFDKFDLTSFSGSKKIGLNDILNSLDKAKTDDNVKGLLIDATSINGGSATIEEIRNKLIDFKMSGKFIVAYSEYYTQSAYYLSSVADTIYLNPSGDLEFKGITAQVVFFKKALEKLDIEPQIIRHGKFKSAVEPFLLTEMSESNKIQTSSYVNSMWNSIVLGVSSARNITSEKLNQIASELLIRKAEDAITHKLVDQLAYRDEVLDKLVAVTGAESIKKLNLMGMDKYKNAPGSKSEINKDKIAVIYAVGSIGSGEGDAETIGSEGISKAIRDARLDEKVKAIVLRVNSPGGSALASEVIWREMNLAKQKKPVIVSMGNLAASGGYYIACMADTIVASPNTITGSIGVFGVLFNMQNFFDNKLGVNIDTVKSNQYADLGAFYRPLTTNERSIVQNSVEHIYDIFVTRVSDGRKLTKAQVDSIGQGRVWSGTDALRIGLVDVLGGLETAIDIAANKAGLTNYRLVNLPEQKDPFQKLMSSFSSDVKSSIIKNELGDQYRYYQMIQNVMSQKGVQARLEYDVIID
jgi:protease IV